jgi:DNA polymerase kappa
MAKISSGVNKPDGTTYLGFTEEEIQAFMNDQPIRKVPGIGKVNELILNGLGIKTC